MSERVVTTTHLHLFRGGNRDEPRRPRTPQDIVTDEEGYVGPERGPMPDGLSLFGDPDQAPIRGHFHRLPAGTLLPTGIGLIADGADIDPDSPRSPTHHTLYPTTRMTFESFVELVMGLPWEYWGKKR